jgi:glycosyltransferase involved in cell wall biosynthesis
MKNNIFLLLPNLSGGGQEKVASRLSFAFVNSYNVRIVLFQRKINYPYAGNLTIFHSQANRNFLWKIKEVHKRINLLKKYIELDKPKAIISFGESANLVNILTHKKKSKTILSIHQDFSQNFEIGKVYKELHLIAYRFLYKRANRIITVSKRIENYLIERFKISQNKVKTIYNPIEVEEVKIKLKEALEEYEFLKSFPYLLNVGRLSKQKGQWYLLRIFRQIKKKYKDLKLVILGEGELKDYLVELSQNLGLKTYVWDRDKLNESYDVYFLGFQENPYKFIKYSKAFVFTSLWEGFGNVLVEALAVGKTIISTDCRTGPREILAPKTDFLLETNKPQPEEFGILMPTFERKLLKANDLLTLQEKMWIDTLLEVLNNEKLLRKYELKAPRRAWDFHIDKISQQWLDVIEE